MLEPERIDLLRRLLKLARAGKCGAVYCVGERLQLGTDPLYGGRWPITWEKALKLANDLEAEQVPVIRKPVASTKRSARLPRAQDRKRA